MDPFLGEIRMFTGDYAPRGWALCDGQIMSIAEYSGLFAIIGDRFGGDGRSTFALPDLRGRAPIGMGTGPGLTPRNLAHRGGLEHVVLSNQNLPSHNHYVGCDITSERRSLDEAPLGNVPGKAEDGLYGNDLESGNVMNEDMISHTGENHPHENMPPWLAINYIISLDGIWPSRS